MSLSLYDVTVPTLVGALTTLKGILGKAAEHAEANKIEPSALLHARLFPDMFSFTRQIQVATDLARRGVARLAGDEPESTEDKETTFAELIARVDATIEVVKAADKAPINGGENREFTLDLGQTVQFTGRSYVLTFLFPNVLFHATTAYNILRHNGVQLGKRDFIAPFIAL